MRRYIVFLILSIVIFLSPQARGNGSLGFYDASAESYNESPLRDESVSRTDRIAFAPGTPLSSGKWVKISIDKTGVYEISYDTLREMGFPDPSGVGVYGRGGVPYDFNFTTLNGTAVYHDGLAEVPVLHHSDKLYFYGAGTMLADVQPYSSTMFDAGGYFIRKAKNIYCNAGCYFLSDCNPPKKMDVVETGDLNSIEEMKEGIGYAYHEEDLFQNNSGTGQLFYGEKLTPESPRFSTSVDLTGALPESRGVMVCEFYVDRSLGGAVLSYGLEGSERYAVIPAKLGSTTDFTPLSPVSSLVDVPSAKGKVFVNLDHSQEVEVSNLDYWMLTYKRSVPSLSSTDGSGLAQDCMALPALGMLRSAKLRIPGGGSYLALDVANPAEPVFLEVAPDGADGMVRVRRQDNRIPQLVVFNPLKTQLHISGYEDGYSQIAGKDLHSQAIEGADLVIICIPQLKESAERLARLHREKDGMRVIVATSEECYNEFSSGLPDPMAYRALVKMAYESDYSCRNVLLMGPLFSDFRGILNERNPLEGLIAYQDERTNTERWAFNANDYLGMMSNCILPSAIEKETMQVGVGILPVRYPAEAETVIDKIEAYLDFDDFAYYLNHILNIGGVGDNHIHDRQTLAVANYINAIDNGSTVFTPLIVDAYGFKAANEKLFSVFDSGVGMAYYFGHGAPTQLNRYGDFFDAADVLRFRNRVLPFVCFAGCKLSLPDLGIRGLGETLVTSTPYGAVGTLISTRETFSTPNQNFIENFFLSMYSHPNSSKARTIGEIFAEAKSRSVLSNELAFLLVCDPALVIPYVSRGIALDNDAPVATPGEFMVVSGYVEDGEGNCDASFNGTAVIKLMEPYTIAHSADLCSRSDSETLETVHDLDVVYCDTQLSAAAATVVDGKFTARMFIPHSASAFHGKIGRLHVTAYSPSDRLAAGSMHQVDFGQRGSGTMLPVKDMCRPVVEVFEYMPEKGALRVRASDNLAMAYDSDPFRSATHVYIDGREYKAGQRCNALPQPDSRAFEMTVPVYGLSEGKHTARVVVKDAFGNSGISEIVFDYSEYTASYSLKLEGAAVNESGVFFMEGTLPSDADLVIVDSSGMLVWRTPIRSEGVEWSREDYLGRRVPSGIYKAYVLEKGGSMRKTQSQPIDVPVI